jgi:hypothetical protein
MGFDSTVKCRALYTGLSACEESAPEAAMLETDWTSGGRFFINRASIAWALAKIRDRTPWFFC